MEAKPTMVGNKIIYIGKEKIPVKYIQDRSNYGQSLEKERGI